MPKLPTDFRSQCREYTPRAVRKLVSTIDDPKASRKDQIAAAIYILDAGWGRPTQKIEGEMNVNYAISDQPSEAEWIAAHVQPESETAH